MSFHLTIRTTMWTAAAIVLLACTGGKYIGERVVKTKEISEVFARPIQVTAGNASNYAPDLSPNGAYVIFTSDKAGNRDLWEKKTTGGFQRPITTHSADDFSPVLSPDGTMVAFVSRRADAAGDIHVVDLGPSFGKLLGDTEGTITNVDLNRTEDMDPRWYPDSSRIVFTSRRPGEEYPSIYYADVDDMKPIEFGDLRGEQPTVSPDGQSIAFVRAGALFLYTEEADRPVQLTAGGLVQDGQPRFSPDGSKITFIRYADDTNRDGRLDADDRPTLWLINLQAAAEGGGRTSYLERPLTTAGFAAYSPQYRQQNLYFTMQNEDSLDIFMLPGEGQVSPATTLDSLRERLQRLDNYYERILLLRLSQWSFFSQGDAPAAYEAALLEIDELVEAGRSVESKWVSEKLASIAATSEVVVNLTKLKLAELELQRLLYPDVQRELTGSEVAYIDALIAVLDGLALGEGEMAAGVTADRGRVAGEAGLLKIKALASKREFFAANELADQILVAHAGDAGLLPRVRIYKALIAPATTGLDNALRMLVDVVRDYSSAWESVDQSSQTAIRLIDTLPQDQQVEKLAALRTESAGLPLIAATAHMKIADIFEAQGKPEVAANELRQIVESYPESPNIVLEAARELSAYYEVRNRYQSSEKMLSKLQATLSSSLEIYQQEGRAELLAFYLRRGRALIRQKDYNGAIGQFDQVLELDEQNIQAHRGRINALIRRGDAVEALVEEYESRIERDPENARWHYLHGYALTYKIDGADSIPGRLSAIYDALDPVLDARSLDGQILEIHQTLGWLDLQLGYWIDRMERASGVRSYVYGKSRMVQKALGFGDPNWLEVAIDAFLTAYTLAEPKSIEQAELAQNLGHTYFELKNFKRSLNYYLQRVRLLDIYPMGDERSEAVMFRRAGQAAFAVADLAVTESLQRRALLLWERLGRLNEVKYSLDALALTLREQGKFQESVAIYERLLAMNGEEATGNLASVNANLAVCHFELKEFVRALAYLDAAESVLDKIDPKQLSTAGNSGAIKLDIFGQRSAAAGFDYFDRRNLIASFRAKIYGSMGRQDLAIEAMRRKVELLRSHRKNLGAGKNSTDLAEELAIAYNNLAVVLAGRGQYLEALASYEAAESFAQKLRPADQEFPNEGEVVNRLGRLKVLGERAQLGLAPDRDLQTEQNQALEQANQLVKVFDDGSKAQGPLAVRMYVAAAELGRLALKQSDEDFGKILARATKVALPSKQNIAAPRIYLASLGLPQGFEQSVHDEIEAEKTLAAAQAEVGSDPQNDESGGRVDGELESSEDRAGSGSTDDSEDAPLLVDDEAKVDENLQLVPDEEEPTPDGNSQEERETSDTATSVLPDQLGTDVKDSTEQNKEATESAEQVNPASQESWIELGNRRQWDRSFEDLMRTLESGGSLKSILNRQQAINVFAKVHADLMDRGDQQQAAIQLARFQRVYARSVVRTQLVRSPEDAEIDKLIAEMFAEQTWTAIDELPGGVVLGFQDSAGLFQLHARRNGRFVHTIVDSPDRAKLGEAVVQLAEGSSQVSFALIGQTLQIELAEACRMNGLKCAFVSSPDQLVYQAQRLRSQRRTVLVVGSRRDFERLAGKLANYDVFHIDRDDIVTQDEMQFAAFDIVHVSAPTQLYAGDPSQSVISTGHPDISERSVRDISLSELARLKSVATSMIVLNDVVWIGGEVAAAGAGQEASISLQTAALVAGIPSVVLRLRQVEATDQFNWQLFYKELSEASLADAVIKVPNSVLLGAHGLSKDRLQELADESWEDIWTNADDAFDDRNWVQASTLYRSAYEQAELAEADGDDVQLLLKGAVESLYSQQRYSEALHYKLKMAARVKAQEDHDPLDYALETMDAAVLAVRAEDGRTAEQMLAVTEKVAKEEEEEELVGKVYRYRGQYYLQANRYQDALEAYKAAREAYREVAPIEAARQAVDIANLYRDKLSDFPEAVKAYQTAAAELQALNDTRGYLLVAIDRANTMKSLGQLGAAINLLENRIIPAIPDGELPSVRARAYQILAVTLYQAGLYQDAQEYNDLTTDALGDIESELRQAEFEVDALNLKGMILSKLGRYEEGYDEFREAVYLAREYRMRGKVSQLYNNLGFWERERGRLSRSLRYLEEALRIDQDLKDQIAIAYDQRNLALTILANGEVGRAKDLLFRALATSKELGLSYNLAYCELGLGDVAMAESNWEEAEAAFARAYKVSVKGYMQDFMWRALAGRATAMRKLGRVNDSLAQFKQATSIVEMLRSGLKNDNSSNGFLSDRGVQEMYEEYAWALSLQGKFAEAWQVNERSRGRALIDSLGQQALQFADSKTQEMLAREKSLRVELGLERLRVERSGGKRKPTAQQSLQKQYDDLVDEIRDHNPQALDFAGVTAIEPAEVGRRLGYNAGLIQYMVADDGVIVWLLRDGKVEGRTVQVDSVVLAESIQEFIKLMENYSTAEFLATELGDTLIAPILSGLEGVDSVAIVPHRELHALPFASLMIEEGYFGETVAISYLERASMVRYLADSGQSNFGAGAKVVAFAGGEMPFTIVESDVIKRYFPNSDVLRADESTVAKVRAASGTADILHIATHGEFDRTAPLRSHLQIGEPGASERLTAAEIFSWERVPPKVTLSACETGRGEVGRGDEVVGLHRAFFFAGANTVVSTLWRIADVPSAMLMKRYYRYLAAGDSPAKSMQRAQAVVRRYFRHPAYWAGYRVMGRGW